MARPLSAPSAGVSVSGCLLTLRSTLSRERHLLGAALLRLGLGAVLLFHLLWQWDHRHFLWGPNGIYPQWLFARELPAEHAPSLFNVSSETVFDALYLLTIGAIALFTVGYKARWAGIWLYVLIWSLFNRNPMLLTGGEKLLLAVLPFVLMLDTGAYLSVDRRLAGSSLPPPGARPYIALFHNIGLVGIFAQLSITYGFAGLAKLTGELWRDGSAVGYVLQSPQFSLPALSPLTENDLVIRTLTYATLMFELGFPFLIWSGRTRWIAQVMTIVFHLGVAIVMGLVLFAGQALVLQLALVPDAWYGRRWQTLRRLRHSPTEVVGTTPAV